MFGFSAQTAGSKPAGRLACSSALVSPVIPGSLLAAPRQPASDSVSLDTAPLAADRTIIPSFTPARAPISTQHLLRAESKVPVAEEPSIVPRLNPTKPPTVNPSPLIRAFSN